jgi:hypothetical protein
MVHESQGDHSADAGVSPNGHGGVRSASYQY